MKKAVDGKPTASMCHVGRTAMRYAVTLAGVVAIT